MTSPICSPNKKAPKSAGTDRGKRNIYLMIDTLLCETCHESPCKWGYNDCARCLKRQYFQQLQGLAEAPDNDPVFDEPIDDPHANDIPKAQGLILTLQRMFQRHASTPRDLRDATEMFILLEKLHINRSSDAWAEVERLKRIWNRRILLQDSY
jgi:hypothetical protein